jgi:hypothetical protein
MEGGLIRIDLEEHPISSDHSPFTAFLRKTLLREVIRGVYKDFIKIILEWEREL